MAIVASGEISLGGNATATRSVACELGRSGTAAICMDENAVRTLAARTTAGSAICMNDFYNKSNFPLGQFYCGGYYTGTISSPGNYYLIVAPNATGCANCKWKTNNTSTGNCSNATCNDNNGYWNTFTYLNNSDHPAGNWTATRSIGGFSDWYLPARNELNVLYANSGSMPAGEGYILGYWSSTEATPEQACFLQFATGSISALNKCYFGRVRAVRRQAF